jgi:DNA-binding NtrC family response regulator
MAESLNICVVDDDRDVAEGLAEILELAGHQVRTAFSGQDALGILDEADFDIAFLNANLPEQTRLESFMQIRKAKPDMKAVMMTGYTIEQLLRQAVHGGSVTVLQKPVAMDEVLRALEGAKPRGVILVAEDDPDIRHKISDTLALQDYRVGTARAVGDALDMVFANECDILVLDLRLPVIDALEVYLELEKHDRALPTIVISSAPDKDNGPIDLLRDQTITGVLVKPFDPARLLAVLGKMHKNVDAPVVEEPAIEYGHADGNRGRILVIDDDRDLAEGLADILRELGHSVEIAFNGSDALEIARRFDAQIALVDIKLGRTSGLELISSLKELRPGIVNVVITANAGKESVIAALRSGAFDFLNKPMHPQDLFVILERCFEQIRAHKDNSTDSAEPASEFVASASHELRDPLNAVIGFSEILGDEMLGPLGSDQYVHYAKGINEAGQHLTSVIDDIFENTGEGSQELETEEPRTAPPQGATDPPADSPEQWAKPPSAEPLADLPEHSRPQPSDTEPGDPNAGDPEVQAQQLGGGPSGDPQSSEPAPLQKEPGWPEKGALPPYEEPSARVDPGSTSAEKAFAGPSEANESEFGAAPHTPKDPEPAAAGETAMESTIDPGGKNHPPPVWTGTFEDETHPLPPESEESPGGSAGISLETADYSRPSEAEAGPIDLGHTEPEQPAAAWPEPSETDPVDSEQRGLDAPDPGAGHAFMDDVPATEAVTEGSRPDRGEGAEHETEDEEEGHEDQGPELTHEDREKKILRFSPFKKVI